MQANIEKIWDIKEEIEPLLESHWKEVAWYQDDVKLNPDWNTYYSLQEADSLVVFTLRNNEEQLVGYASFVVNWMLHYKNHKIADNDVVFIVPEYRKGRTAYSFLKGVYKALEDMGVSIITTKMKSDNEFHGIMKRMDFDLMEYNYTKLVK